MVFESIRTMANTLGKKLQLAQIHIFLMLFPIAIKLYVSS